MSLPVVTIVGNLSRIESKFIPSGKQVVKFQVECSEKDSKGEWKNLYINGEVWDKAADFFMKYFKDGSVAIVTGKLVTNVYAKQDGTKVYENKFLFPNVSFAPREKESNNGQTNNVNNNGGYQQQQQNNQYQNQANQQQQYQQNPQQVAQQTHQQQNVPTINLEDEIPF